MFESKNNDEYYETLGLEKGCFAGKNDKECKNILNEAYAYKIRYCHPDYPDGTAEKFQNLIQALSMLSYEKNRI